MHWEKVVDKLIELSGESLYSTETRDLLGALGIAIYAGLPKESDTNGNEKNLTKAGQ
jgi:hypothetical protein